MSQIMECKLQTNLPNTNSTNPSLNPGQRSMDYGQWADHPLTIDHCLLGKGLTTLRFVFVEDVTNEKKSSVAVRHKLRLN